MRRDLATAPLAAGGLIAGYAVAVISGSRPLGGLVLAGFGLACISIWTRRDGLRVAAKLTSVRTGRVRALTRAGPAGRGLAGRAADGRGTCGRVLARVRRPSWGSAARRRWSRRRAPAALTHVSGAKREVAAVAGARHLVDAREPRPAARRAGQLRVGLGTQATLVALPYQLYVETHSALLVGLLGAVELVPLMVDGAARRRDRRPHGPPPAAAARPDRARAGARAGLRRSAFAGSPPVAVLYVLGGAAGRLQRAAERGPLGDRADLVAREQLRSALALNYGLYHADDGDRAGTRRPADRRARRSAPRTRSTRVSCLRSCSR